MGPRYQTIASFVEKGPAVADLNMGEGLTASLVVENISPPSPAPAGAPFSSFALVGPCGNKISLDEEQISHIQPEGPQEGTSLYISLDNGVSLVLSRGAR